MPSYKNMFVTGCDESNEWMLPWFMSNYKKYNNYPIAFADFGVSKEFKNYVDENKTQKTFFKEALCEYLFFNPTLDVLDANLKISSLIIFRREIYKKRIITSKAIND